MHSRIYQISKQPIDKDDYIEESRYYDHWFIGAIADYVNGDTDREADIEWIKGCYDNKGLSFGTDDAGEYFVVTDKAKYFAERFEMFQETIKELSKFTLDDFASNRSRMQMCTLESIYDDEFAFYVDGDDTGLETFYSCIRSSSNGTKFYIGATIEYHY